MTKIDSVGLLFQGKRPQWWATNTDFTKGGLKGLVAFLSFFEIKKSGFERHTVDFTLLTTAPHAFTPSRTVNT